MVEIEKLQHEGNLGKSDEKSRQIIRSNCVENDLNNLNRDSQTVGHRTNGLPFPEKVIPKVQKICASLQKLRITQEKQSFVLKLPAVSNGDHIGIAERDSAVTTIKSMQRFYNYSSETLDTSVNYLDRFITKMKVKRKYLSCVAAASFFLATKMNEEPEHHPSASDLASLNRYSWKPSDLKRMEKIILEKLGWNLFPVVTCLSYLHNICEMLKLLNTDIDDSFFKTLTTRSEMCINYTRCSVFTACTQAVSITLMGLKEAGRCSLINKCLLLHVQNICQITDSELFDCQCAISNQLKQYNIHPESHPRCLPMPKIIPRPNLVKRPSFYGNTDLPTIDEVPCSCENSEEVQWTESYGLCPPMNYLCYPETAKMSQSYCLLVDQCYCKDGAYYLCKTKCNMSIA